MSKLTFEQTKQLVAERHSHKDWDSMVALYTWEEHEQAIKEAAELLAQSLANEAVKLHNEKILANQQKLLSNYGGDPFIKRFALEHMPLPYPELEPIDIKFKPKNP